MKRFTDEQYAAAFKHKCHFPALASLTEEEHRRLRYTFEIMQSDAERGESTRYYESDLDRAGYSAAMRALCEILHPLKPATCDDTSALIELIDYTAAHFQYSKAAQLQGTPKKMLRHEVEVSQTAGYVAEAAARIKSPEHYNPLSSIFGYARYGNTPEEKEAISAERKIALARIMVEETLNLESQIAQLQSTSKSGFKISSALRLK